MDLKGKRILVTGGTGELGSRISAGLREAGARTVIVGRQSDRLATALAHSEAFAVDLLAPGSGNALVTAVTSSGSLDGIVFAHGVVAFGPVADVPADVIATLTTLNLTCNLEIIHAAIPALRMAATAGREPFVVTISGVISESAVAGMAAYGASKAGLRHFVAAAQRELRREKIRVFDSRPPHTETGLAGRAIFGQAPSFPLGKAPDEVATRIVRAISSDETDLPSSEF